MTQSFNDKIIYIKDGYFQNYDNGIIINCGCSILYRKLPYTLEEYENKQLFADLLTGCDR